MERKILTFFFQSFNFKEKEHVLELWQMVSQELERLQQIYQEHMTEAQIHIVERQKQKVMY